jgi:hypothetical protein
MAPIPKRKTERAPPIDKLLKPAIGVGLALLVYQFFKGLDAEVCGRAVYSVQCTVYSVQCTVDLNYTVKRRDLLHEATVVSIISYSHFLVPTC